MLFLNSDEVAELTDIRKGKDKKTREQLQIEHLIREGIPHRVSARGAPKIARCVIEGGKQEKPKADSWTPNALRAA